MENKIIKKESKYNRGSYKIYVKYLMKDNDPSHDWYHVERVWKNACFISKQESSLLTNLSLDLLVIELASLFHDIVDFKYDHDKLKSLIFIALN